MAVWGKIPPTMFAQSLLGLHVDEHGHVGGNDYEGSIETFLPWLEIQNLAQNSIGEMRINLLVCNLYHKGIKYLCTLIATILASHICSRCSNNWKSHAI